jgi:hypothetical protein
VSASTLRARFPPPPPSTRPREGEDDGTLRRGQSTWTCQRPRRASGSVTASARSDSPAVWCIGGRWLRNRTPRPRAAADPLGHVARAALLASWPMLVPLRAVSGCVRWLAPPEPCVGCRHLISGARNPPTRSAGLRSGAVLAGWWHCRYPLVGAAESDSCTADQEAGAGGGPFLKGRAGDHPS